MAGTLPLDTVQGLQLRQFLCIGTQSTNDSASPMVEALGEYPKTFRSDLANVADDEYNLPDWVYYG